MALVIDCFLAIGGLPPLHWIDDGWCGKDKPRHFALHFAIGFVYTYCFGTCPGGIVFSEAFGFAWEMVDSYRGVGASWKDLVVNNLGLAAGTILGLLLRRYHG